MPNYQNGKIYTIRSRSRPDLVYIGSTTQGLAMRFGEHNRKYRQWLNGKANDVTSFRVIEIGDAYIELLENFPCNSKEELHAREGHHMREIDCVNRCIAGRTKAEYYQDNREAIALTMKQYHQDNRDARLIQAKQYHQDNREAHLIQMKQYYEENTEVQANKKKERIHCPYCDTTFARCHKATHFKSIKHITNFIEY